MLIRWYGQSADSERTELIQRSDDYGDWRKDGTPILDACLVRLGRKDLFLLPGGGSHSQRYRNALKSKRIKISSGKVSLDLIATPMTDSNRLGSVVEKFRKKYGPTYYSDPERFDVALSLTLP